MFSNHLLAPAILVLLSLLPGVVGTAGSVPPRFLASVAEAPGQEAPELATTLVEASQGSIHSSGPPVPLPVQVTNVQRLGAATVLITYDPAIIKAVACQRSNAFDVGLCNTNVDRNSDGKADAVLFNAVSLMGVTAGAAPVALVNISWKAVAVVTTDTTTALGVQVQTFADVDAHVLANTTQDGQVTLLPALTFKTLFLPLTRR